MFPHRHFLLSGRIKMNAPVELSIDKLIKGGLGLGRLADGQVIMIPRVLPGELVRVIPKRKHSHYLEADLLEVIKPSLHRVIPICPAYDRCGGCALQHVAYPEQIRLKNMILGETLSRAGLCRKEELPAVTGEPLASPAPFAYRQRIRLQASRGRLGYFTRHSHSLVPISFCPLAREVINTALSGLLGERNLQLLLELAVSVELIEDPSRDKVFLLVHYPRKTRPAEHKAARELCRNQAMVAAVIFNVENLSAGPCFDNRGEIPIAELRIELSLPFALGGGALNLALEPGGFCQVNAGQNENCIRLLLDWLKTNPAGKALDLFCGMGNFSLPLAASGWDVTGTDLQRSTIRSARHNAIRSGVAASCHFIRDKAVEAAKRLLSEGARFDCLILDPPRSGCVGLIPLLPGFKARQIIYISCDPATMARDLTGLIGAGYHLAEARMVDMFPQTAEQESMVRLEKD